MSVDVMYRTCALMLLIGADDSPVPIFDTTALHAHVAIAISLGA